MKCVHCGAEIKDGAKFCQACGAKQDVPTEERRFCKSCGAPLKPGAAFCTACGAKITTEPQQKPEGGNTDTPAASVHTEQAPLQQKEETKINKVQNSSASNASMEQSSPSQHQTAPQKAVPKKKGYLPVIIIVAVLLCAGIVAVALKFTVFSAPTDEKTAENTSDTSVEQETKQIKEVDSEPIDSSDADLVADDEVSLQGTVKVSTDNRLFLEWGEPMSILLKEDDGEFVKLNDVSSAYLQNDGVDISLWSELPLEQKVLVTGELELDGSQLILKANRMTDPNGNAIVTEAEEAVSEEILPESDSRLLTQKDIEGLSLQQINYAKNEIYARHGRKFASKELQNYFNAQSWYHGTVDAADFNESVLSDVEKKNAEFLAEVEFSIAPNGYQLDQ